MGLHAESSLNDWRHWHRDHWEETFGQEESVENKLLEAWPEKARIAVLLTFDTQGDIDAAVPGYQSNSGYWAEGKINYNDLTQRQYGTRRGVQRILNILEKYEIRATFPTCGLTADWYPEVVKEIASRGHEVAVHGHYHIPLFNLTEEEEREEIRRAKTAIEQVLGGPAVGWRSPMYSVTPNTIRLLTEEGFLYGSDFHNDDMPYLLKNNGKQLVQIPAGLDDYEMYIMHVQGISMGGQLYGTPGDVTDLLVSEFEMLYEESQHHPRVFQYCMHPKITGRPHRAYGLQQFIAHMKSRPGVWFCTMEELARLCI